MLCRQYTKGASHSQWPNVLCVIFSPSAFQLPYNLFRILAVLNQPVFCNNPVLIVTPSFSSHASNLLLTTPSAPTTTGTTFRCPIPHSLPMSLLRSLYFSIFSPYFSYTLWSQGEAMSTMIAMLFSFSKATMSDLLASITWSHWMVISHKILHFSFFTIPSGWCSFHF